MPSSRPGRSASPWSGKAGKRPSSPPRVRPWRPLFNFCLVPEPLFPSPAHDHQPAHSNGRPLLSVVFCTDVPRVRGRPQMRCCHWTGQGGSPHHGLQVSIQEPPARPRRASLIRPGPRFRYPWSDPSARPRLAHFPCSWWILVVACRLVVGRCLGRPPPCVLGLAVSLMRVRVCVGVSWSPPSLPPSHSTRRVCLCLCVVVSLCSLRARLLQVDNRNSSGTLCSLLVIQLASPLHSSATRQFVRTAPAST